MCKKKNVIAALSLYNSIFANYFYEKIFLKKIPEGQYQLKVILPSEVQQNCYFWNVDCHLGYHGNRINQSETSNEVT